MSREEQPYAAIFDVNVRSFLFAAQEATQRFGAEGGRIINLSPGLVLRSWPSAFRLAYGATGAAVNSITKA